MKALTLLATCIIVTAADSVTFLQRSEVTADLINDPRYILYENEDGLVEVEDLTVNTTGVTLFASENTVSFWLYTRRNRDVGNRITQGQLTNITHHTQFNPSLETLVIIHGWKGGINASVNRDIKNAALQSRNVNVIVVDWNPIAKRSYSKARRAVTNVGNYVGDFLIRLTNGASYQWNKITVVGYSLGAHIAGNAGARTKARIETIVGLDPAGPLFLQSKRTGRLGSTDAKYVQVIHTAMAKLGCQWRSGDVDFYPDGGRRQSGCGLDTLGNCAHGRAYIYYAESLRGNKFLSRNCGSWYSYKKNRCNGNRAGYMGGYPVHRPADGTYFLRVNGKSPFGRG